MIKFEYILFWILILSIIGISIWLAFGSSEFQNSLITIGIFVATSEILLWKFLFRVDNKTSLGFEKVRSNFEVINNRLINIEKDIKEIKVILLPK